MNLYLKYKAMKAFLFICLCFSFMNARGQDDLRRLFDTLPPGHQPVIATFKSGNIINAQSNETVHKHDLVFAITHRFGDIGGSYGGVKTLYGLDNSTDIKIAFEYGISDRLMIGVARTKGAAETRFTQVPFNSLRQLWEFKIKYRLLQQTTDSHQPFSLTLFANAVASSQPAFEALSSDIHFQQFSDRWSFIGQAILTRKMNDNLSLAILPTYFRRNFVAFGDEHDLFALGFGGRLKCTKNMAILFDGFMPFRSKESVAYFKSNHIRFQAPLAIGWEIQTAGHVFHVIFTNATAILENQFIPYTTRSWGKGAFRWGFTISRTFTLKH